MTRREFISGCFSRERAKELYKSVSGFNDELKKADFPTGDKDLLKYVSKIQKKSNIIGKEGKK